MIRRLIPLVTLVLSGSAIAQVGIGIKKATSSAQLEVLSDKKGVLLPRLELYDKHSFYPIEGAKVESLLVYHTGNSNLEAGFYYWKNNAWIPLLSGDTFVDRQNNTFTIEGNPNKNGEESLVITDSENHSVYLAVAEIANNSTFVTNLVENKEFTTKLGDNIEFIKHITTNNEFIENIFNELKNKYGNVSYDALTKKFYYFDINNTRQEINWADLNTTNISFTLDNDYLVVTDSNDNKVRLSVVELANNKIFVENIANNNDFITKLGDNVEFIKHITENNEFIENIINELKGEYGNVNFNTTDNKFYYIDEHGNQQEIDWSKLNTTNVSFALTGDQLVITDSDNNAVRLDVKEIANNNTFVTNLAENQEFITKLGDNVEFIKHITENNEFIENIINELKGEYGNVNFNTTDNKFYYIDEHGNQQEIDWSKLNTTNVSFALTGDQLVITDSDNNAVRLDVKEIANNNTFVTNLVENQEFITKLGDNVEFIKHITENNKFIENIINELKGEYGNVNFNTTDNKFYYIDEYGDQQEIDWSKLNTTNVSFALTGDQLVITDSDNNAVRLDVKEIANNNTFVTNLVENQEFITKLGNNVEFIKHITENNKFIENIINELKGEYGNVNFNTTDNKFYYIDEYGDQQEIDWSKLNTTNVSFALTGDQLVITDSDNNAVRLDVKEIANNNTFVTNLVENQEFITKLGDNVEFIKHITENNKFIENIINELKGEYGNVNFNTTDNKFYYIDEYGDQQEIDWSKLNTTNVSFALTGDQLVITDSDNNAVRLDVKEIANNNTFVTNLVENQEFITKLGNKEEFITQITNNEQFVKNIIKELKGTYGNVGYDTVNNTFFYYDEHEQPIVISWDALGNTKIKSFVVTDEFLTITDTENTVFQVSIDEFGNIIANNDVFVTNLVENQEFITKLGNKEEFITQITNNEQFVKNIIKELKGTYGNVGYDTVNNTFFYYDEHEQPIVISWDALGNTKIKSFVVTDEFLTITDTENTVFQVSIDEFGNIIANNDVFVTNLVENQEFITKLGNKEEFITQITNNEQFVKNIIKELKGTYGNVGYDTVNNTFFYYDEHEQPIVISWDALGNTKIKSFVVTDEFLTITDTENTVFQVSIDELGKIIANNDVFVTNLVENQEFITKLGNKEEFITEITNNEQFVKNIIKELKGTYGNVGYDTVNNTFFYYDEHEQPIVISWDALGNTKIKSFVVTDEFLTITDTENTVFQVSIDEFGNIIANNDVFVTNLVENQEFITKLGNKEEFITQITNNEQFVKNIIKELKGTYGNVGYDTVNNTFFYYDEHEQPIVISWDALGNTKIKSFVVTDEFLTITDTENTVFQVSIDELGKIIANNDVFVTNLVENQEFITKLGNKEEFITQITNNEQFVKNIIKELKGTYGNVGYDTVNNTFFYYDEHEQPIVISWDALGNTKIKSFVVTDEFLTITDTENTVFQVSIDELGKIIANNDVFVTNLVENQEFITKLGNKEEFITQITNNEQFVKNIIKELKGTYGNVGYDTVNNTFFYYDEHEQPIVISWDALGNTKIKSFVVTDEFLTIADTENTVFQVSIDELGKIIANNDVFVTNLAENNDFITKLGDNNTFKTIVKNSSAETTLTLTDGTVNPSQVQAGFTYNNGKDATVVQFEETLTEMDKGVDVNQLTEYYFIDETGQRDAVVIQVSQDIINDFEKIIATESVKILLETFISKTSGDVVVSKDSNGNIIIKTPTDTFNLTDEIKANETNTILSVADKGVYVYKNEEAIKTGVAGVTINVVADVQNNFQEIIDNTSVQNILNEYINDNVSNIEVIEKNGDTYFVINEGGVTKEYNITELIKANAYLASVTVTDETVNEAGVQAGFSFNDGKNVDSKVVAETLTSLNKGVDGQNLIAYTYKDETGKEASTKITVSQDIITDFDKIIQNDTVKTLLQTFISQTSGDVAVVRNAAGDIVITTGKGTEAKSFNLTEEIKDKETKTTLVAEKYTVYVYMDEVNGEYLEVHEENQRVGETELRIYETTKFVYKNEVDESVEIKGTDLFGATGSGSLETITSLVLENDYAGLGKAIVFENEEKAKNPIFIKDIFNDEETLTRLEAKLDSRELIYSDEERNNTIISFNDIVQEPWYTGSDVQATKNDQDIYTMGWVGIGYKEKSGAPNERLRVNGSITATNSYYADYVFEKYFDGYSSLKYDYAFNDLSTVDNYIKTNRHLPGITPISELEKTDSGYSFNVSELSIQLLEKTEELFLHVIEQKKELDQKADEIQVLKSEVKDLTERLEAIEALLK